MIIETFKQNSPEWEKAKAGIPSASRFSEIVTVKGDYSKQVDVYINHLLAEKMLGKIINGYESYDIRMGKENEPDARDQFKFLMGLDVVEVGLIWKDELKKVLCSPDGLIPNIENPTAGLEIKCPKASTHIYYLRTQKLPSVYFQQVQGSMYVTGLSEWYFMSYYPGLQSFIIKIKRNDEWIEKFHNIIEEKFYSDMNTAEFYFKKIIGE